MSNDLRDFVLRVSERVGHGERTHMSGHACDFVCFGEGPVQFYLYYVYHISTASI